MVQSPWHCLMPSSPMNAVLGVSFVSFVDQLVLSPADDQTLLIVFDATGAQELQPTDTHARHRSSPLYLHKAKLIDMVQIQTLETLMALISKLMTEKYGYGDGTSVVSKRTSPPSRLAVWGLLSTTGCDPKIQVALSRLCKASTDFEIIIGEPRATDASESATDQIDFKTWDALSKWCEIKKCL